VRGEVKDRFKVQGSRFKVKDQLQGAMMVRGEGEG
jgi:hypothetical protein